MSFENMQLSEKLHETCNQMMSQFNLCLCVTHGICGVEENSGFIRESKIGILDKSGNIEIQDGSSKFFQQFIRTIDRKNTFLNLILKKMKFDTLIDAIEVIFIHHNDEDAAWYNINILNDTNTNPTDLGDLEYVSLKWEYNTAFINEILPKNIELFFDELSQDFTEAQAAKWIKTFEIIRSGLFRTNKDYYQTDFIKKEELWEHLTALQSVLLYFFFSVRDRKLIQGSALFLRKKVTEKELLLCSSLIIRTKDDQFFNDQNFPRAHALLDKINQKIDSIYLNPLVSEYHKFGVLFSKEAKGDSEALFDNSLDNLFYTELQKSKIKTLSRWLMQLVYNLQNEYHEGEKTDFFFVVGDGSEFRDHRNTIVKSISNSN